MKTRDLPTIGHLLEGGLSSVDRMAESLPVVDVRLSCTYSPRSSWQFEAPCDTDHGSLWGHPARVAGPWPEAAPLGLSLARNSDTPPRRNGWHGLTPCGRKAIHRSCAVLDDSAGRLAFWTVTLSDLQLDQIAAVDSWPQFQNAIRHRLIRALHRRGVRAWVVGVVELQPKRTEATRRPAPHIHVCFEGRQHRRARWWLSVAQLDQIIRQALLAAQVDDLDVAACGNVQPVKRSVGRYLSHYMKKGSCVPDVCLDRWELVPRQWFFQSRGLRAVVMRMNVALPVRFVLWVHQNAGHLEEAELLWWRRLPLPDPRAPATYGVQWRGLPQLLDTLALWDEGEWEAEWFSTQRLTHDRTDSRQHPEHDQQLRASSDVGRSVLPVNRKRC